MTGSIVNIPDHYLELSYSYLANMSSTNASLFREWIAPNEVYSSANFSANPHPEAIKWLKANKSMIDWGFLSGNTNPEAIEMLKGNLDKIVWSILSENPSDAALKILKDNKGYIKWDYLARNTNIKMLELIDVKAHWNNMLTNSNKEIREVALYVAWNHANNKPIDILNHFQNSNLYGSTIRSLVETLACDHKASKVPLSMLLNSETSIPINELIPLYKDDPLLVNHIEANLDSFRTNGSIDWSKLTSLWSNPGIYKTNMPIEVSPKTEIELMHDELNDMRNMLDTSRDQFKEIEGRLFKQESRYRKALSLLKSQEEGNASIVSSLREQIECQQAEIDMLSKQSCEQIKEISSLKSQVCDQEEELEELRSDLTSYETTTTELKELTARQEAKIEDLKYINNEGTIELEILRTEKERQASEIVMLRNTLVHQHQRHEDAIDEMHRKLFEQEYDNEDIPLFGCW